MRSSLLIGNLGLRRLLRISRSLCAKPKGLRSCLCRPPSGGQDLPGLRRRHCDGRVARVRPRFPMSGALRRMRSQRCRMGSAPTVKVESMLNVRAKWNISGPSRCFRQRRTDGRITFWLAADATGRSATSGRRRADIYDRIGATRAGVFVSGKTDRYPQWRGDGMLREPWWILSWTERR